MANQTDLPGKTDSGPTKTGRLSPTEVNPDGKPVSDLQRHDDRPEKTADPRHEEPNRPHVERNLVEADPSASASTPTLNNPDGKPTSDLQQARPPVTRTAPYQPPNLADLTDHARAETDPSKALATFWGESLAHLRAALDAGDLPAARALTDDLTGRQDEMIAAVFAGTPINPEPPIPSPTPNPPERPHR